MGSTRNRARSFISALLLLAFCAGLQGQTASPSPSPSPSASASPNPNASLPAQATPVPYSPNEFDPWLLDLRRFEIISVGTFPFTAFFSFFAFDTFRYFANGNNISYAPWPFRGQLYVQPTDEQKIWLIAGAAAFSLVLAAIDYFIVKDKQSRRTQAQPEPLVTPAPASTASTAPTPSASPGA